MKKLSFFKNALFTAAIAFAAASCDDATKEIDNEKPDPEPEVEYIEPFSIEQSEDGMSIEISYDSEAEQYSYAVAVCSDKDAKDIIEAEDPYAAIAEFVESYGADLGDVDEKYIFEGDAVVDLAAVWSVEYDSDYVVAAVAFNGKKEQMSEVASFEFSTPEEPQPEIEYIEPFSIEQSEDGMSIEISYDSDVEQFSYAVAVCSTDNAKNIIEAEDPYAAIAEFVESCGADLDEVDEKYIFEGDAVVDLAAVWSVEYDSDYVVAAVAFNDEKERTSEVASFEFSTPEEPQVEPDVFATIAVSDPTEGSFIASVDVADSYKGNYAIFPTTQDEIDYYGSVEEYVEYYLADDIASYATDYSAVDNYYVFSGDYALNMEDAWTLNPGVEYLAVAVGVEGDGTYAEVITDIVVSEPISTLEGSGGGDEGGAEYPSDIELSSVDFGSIELSNAGRTSFDYSILPADDSMPYLIFAFTDEEYSITYPTDEERISVIYDTYAYLAPYYGYTFSEFIAGSSVPGAYADSYEDLESDTKYHVIAFGIDLDTFQPASAVEVESISTLAPEAPTESLASISVSDVSFENATVSVDAGSYTGYYHIYPASVDMIDNEDLTMGYAGDYTTAFTEAVTYLLESGYEFDPEFEYSPLYYFTGNIESEIANMIWMVEPETEYYLLAAGVDSEGFLTTEVLKSEKFTTGVAPEFNLEIEVSDISDTGAKVIFTPNINSVDYFNDVVLQSDYDAGLVTPESIIESNPYLSYFLSYGPIEWDPELVELEPGTDYCIVAFAYDSELEVATSGMFTESFSTTGEAVSAAASAHNNLVKREINAQRLNRVHTSALTAPSAEAQAKMQRAAAPKSKLSDRVADRYSEAAIRPRSVCRKVAR